MDRDTIVDTQEQADSVFSGISTFGRLPYFPCLASDEEKFDIAFIGRQLGRSIVHDKSKVLIFMDRCTIRYRHLI